ncbi:alpha/beta fold hydrolase [Bradyrhizobium sp. WYCCWR 13023]|uniref:Alpha/beta fold hydrolase n=1 Tax=Bradyrhizobium zhengyangense TaxID=2911009 RepID=A0A9X1R9E5_9BRAD|nr:alpha/beta fold hydrolase [Bradyrhizobium zhengyangense]MCG2626948.1 alpha/beta fold hydrolase [Bradyrhizobium zhengyangense]MCG2637965.1 alpha/beta fold hydrolase [Bradyrhizobium zhengyangense]
MHPRGRTAASMHVAAAVLTVLVSASCSMRPLQGVLVPSSEAVEAASQVPILIGTTRARSSSDPGEMFSREPSSEMAFAQVTVSIPPDGSRKAGEIQWPLSPPGDPRKEFVTASAGYLDRTEFGAAVSSAAKARHLTKTLVFVHGFNNRFDDAVYRYAQFVHDGRLPVIPILFSWPSQGAGNLGSYDHDRKVAGRSGSALTELLDTVNANPAVKEITFVCHSMGCLVTLDALRSRASHGGSVPKLKNVALVAPDIGFDEFISAVGALGPRRPRIGLFLSQDDTALKLSKSLAGGTTRLGDINPQDEPYKSALAQQKILVFDLTHLGGDDSHSRAFGEVGSVMGMIKQRLAQGQQLGEDPSRTASH